MPRPGLLVVDRGASALAGPACDAGVAQAGAGWCGMFAVARCAGMLAGAGTLPA